MKCAQTETLLPLFVGDDLAPREADALRAHLAGCPSCAAQAADFAESRAWLQSLQAPESDARQLDDLRSAVLGAIRAERPRAGWFDRWRAPHWALFAAGLLLLAGLAWLMRGAGLQPAPTKKEDSALRNPAPDEKEAIALGNPAQTRKHFRAGTKPAPRRQPRPSATPTDLAAADGEMLRIEMQTEDPNIRIIWFAPKPGASTNTK